jgi:GT2 family glycosyltransferase
LNLDDQNEEQHCRMLFDPSSYDPAGVRVLIERYRRLLDAISRDPDLPNDELPARSALQLPRPPDLPISALLEMTDHSFEKSVQDELQDLKDRIVKLEARIMADRDFENRGLDQIQEIRNSILKLESSERLLALEARVESIARAFSRVRHQTRRVWLRPPLWTFEQYSPRKLNVEPSYLNEKVPSDAVSIAIVTPAFNHGRYLTATIDSVLTQDYPNLSYVVQDGGSSDNTVDVLRSYGSRLRWRSERDGGQAQAINRAFANCEADVMAYLNSDDMLLPGTLAYVANVLQTRPDIDIVYGHRIFVDRDGLEIGRAVLPRHDAKAHYWASYVPQETMFWRRRVWDKVGPLDESFQYALDWDFTLRAQHAGFRFLRAPRFLACFRVHDEQKTAINYDRGREEMQRLRSRYLGYQPSHREVIRNMMPYLSRQFAVHWLYRCGILRI